MILPFILMYLAFTHKDLSCNIDFLTSIVADARQLLQNRGFKTGDFESRRMIETPSF